MLTIRGSFCATIAFATIAQEKSAILTFAPFYAYLTRYRLPFFDAYVRGKVLTEIPDSLNETASGKCECRLYT